MFDTHTYVKKLEGAGFTEIQAEIQVEALSAVLEEIKETVATKDDLRIVEERLSGQMNTRFAQLEGQIHSQEERLTGQIHSLEERLTGQIHSLEERLTGQIHSLEERLTGQIHSLEERLSGQLGNAIAESQGTTLKWVIGLFVALLGIFVALLKIH